MHAAQSVPGGGSRSVRACLGRRPNAELTRSGADRSVPDARRECGRRPRSRRRPGPGGRGARPEGHRRDGHRRRVAPGTSTPTKPTTPSFSFAPTEPSPGHEVRFSAKGRQGSRFTWDFGDGTAGEGRRTTHTYADPGDYSVLLDRDRAGRHADRGRAKACRQVARPPAATARLPDAAEEVTRGGRSDTAASAWRLGPLSPPRSRDRNSATTRVGLVGVACPGHQRRPSRSQRRRSRAARGTDPA